MINTGARPLQRSRDLHAPWLDRILRYTIAHTRRHIAHADEKFELNGIHAWLYWPAHSLIHTRARPLERSGDVHAPWLEFYATKYPRAQTLLHPRTNRRVPSGGSCNAHKSTRTHAHSRRHWLREKFVIIRSSARVSVSSSLVDDGYSGRRAAHGGPGGGEGGDDDTERKPYLRQPHHR